MGFPEITTNGSRMGRVSLLSEVVGRSGLKGGTDPGVSLNRWVVRVVGIPSRFRLSNLNSHFLFL